MSCDGQNRSGSQPSDAPLNPRPAASSNTTPLGDAWMAARNSCKTLRSPALRSLGHGTADRPDPPHHPTNRSTGREGSPSRSQASSTPPRCRSHATQVLATRTRPARQASGPGTRAARTPAARQPAGTERSERRARPCADCAGPRLPSAAEAAPSGGSLRLARSRPSHLPPRVLHADASHGRPPCSIYTWSPQTLSSNCPRLCTRSAWVIR